MSSSSSFFVFVRAVQNFLARPIMKKRVLARPSITGVHVWRKKWLDKLDFIATSWHLSLTFIVDLRANHFFSTIQYKCYWEVQASGHKGQFTKSVFSRKTCAPVYYIKGAKFFSEIFGVFCNTTHAGMTPRV